MFLGMSGFVSPLPWKWNMVMIRNMNFYISSKQFNIPMNPLCLSTGNQTTNMNQSSYTYFTTVYTLITWCMRCAKQVIVDISKQLAQRYQPPTIKFLAIPNIQIKLDLTQVWVQTGDHESLMPFHRMKQPSPSETGSGKCRCLWQICMHVTHHCHFQIILHTQTKWTHTSWSYIQWSLGCIYEERLIKPTFNLSLSMPWIPWYQGLWGQHGAHLGPTGPRRAPCWPHETCYLGL